MDVYPEFHYNIEKNPQAEEIGNIEIFTSLITRVDMNPTETRFVCYSSPKEFIEDEESETRVDLFNFLTESGVVVDDAVILVQKLIDIASEVTSSDEYCLHYGLSMWLVLNAVEEESVEDDHQIEEAIRASLHEYEMSIGFKPASELSVGALSRRTYKRKSKTRRTSKTSKSRLSDDKCTICIEKFKTGRKLATLPCGHEFHNKCMLEWLKISHVCPLCRFKLPR